MNIRKYGILALTAALSVAAFQPKAEAFNLSKEWNNFKKDVEREIKQVKKRGIKVDPAENIRQAGRQVGHVMNQTAAPVAETAGRVLQPVAEVGSKALEATLNLVDSAPKVANEMLQDAKEITGTKEILNYPLGRKEDPGSVAANGEKAMSDLHNELNRTVKKVKTVAEDPQMLARTAFVYAATACGGPMGGALAGALWDKANNQNMSDEEFFRSLVSGMAAAYVGQNMSGVQGAVAQGVTRDATRLALGEKGYTSQDFLETLLVSSTQVSTGDGFGSKVVDGAINGSKDYALGQIAHQKAVDKDILGDAAITGATQAATTAAVHDFMDKNVIPYIPEEMKNLDKKLIEGIKNSVTEMFEDAAQEAVLEKQRQEQQLQERFADLSDEQKQQLEQDMLDLSKELAEQTAQEKFGVSAAELTAEQAQSPEFKAVLAKNVGSLPQDSLTQDMKDTYNNPSDVSNDVGRKPASIINVLMVLGAAYTAYEVTTTGYDVYTDLQDGKSPEEVYQKYEEDLMWLAGETAATAFLPVGGKYAMKAMRKGKSLEKAGDLAKHISDVDMPNQKNYIKPTENSTAKFLEGSVDLSNEKLPDAQDFYDTAVERQEELSRALRKKARNRDENVSFKTPLDDKGVSWDNAAREEMMDMATDNPTIYRNKKGNIELRSASGKRAELTDKGVNLFQPNGPDEILLRNQKQMRKGNPDTYGVDALKKGSDTKGMTQKQMQEKSDAIVIEVTTDTKATKEYLSMPKRQAGIDKPSTNPKKQGTGTKITGSNGDIVILDNEQVPHTIIPKGE